MYDSISLILIMVLKTMKKKEMRVKSKVSSKIIICKPIPPVILRKNVKNSYMCNPPFK